MLRYGLATLLLLSTAAHADLVDPSEDACTGATLGDRCNLDGEEGAVGTCQNDSCCRNDYRNGTPPETVCSDCLTCQSNANEDGQAGSTSTNGDDESDSGCTASTGLTNGLGLSSILIGLMLATRLRRSRH